MTTESRATTPDDLCAIEGCIRIGRSCLFQNVKKELDPSLDPILIPGIVVREEKLESEADKDKLLRSIAAGRKKLIELEDQLLRLLLEDDELLSTLEISKQTARTFEEQLITSEATEKDIDASREATLPRENDSQMERRSIV